jgi:hypothetical protein
VFLDKKLVIDLGGVHTQLVGNVNLDDLPWLVKGQNYEYVFAILSFSFTLGEGYRGDFTSKKGRSEEVVREKSLF